MFKQYLSCVIKGNLFDLESNKIFYQGVCFIMKGTLQQKTYKNHTNNKHRSPCLALGEGVCVCFSNREQRLSYYYDTDHKLECQGSSRNLECVCVWSATTGGLFTPFKWCSTDPKAISRYTLQLVDIIAVWLIPWNPTCRYTCFRVETMKSNLSI